MHLSVPGLGVFLTVHGTEIESLAIFEQQSADLHEDIAGEGYCAQCGQYVHEIGNAASLDTSPALWQPACMQLQVSSVGKAKWAVAATEQLLEG